MDDEYLIGKLEEALAADLSVGTQDIRVTIVRGCLHLTGEVPSEERRLAVERIAREVIPRLKLCNELTVLELSRAAKPEALGD